MNGLERFADWLRDYVHVDEKGLLPQGLRLQYHSRSARSSQKLAEFVIDDLLAASPVLAAQAERGQVACAIDRGHTWPNGKRKNLDLTIGIPKVPVPPLTGRIRQLAARADGGFSRLLVAIEEKSVMTEHGKSQPRVYSELNDSHVIVHQGDRFTISGGLTVVNIAESFISPLRQTPDQPVQVSTHNQPAVTASMIRHLRGLPIRERVEEVGFDAYCTFVIELDNQGCVELWSGPPAPQPGERDHYDVFLARIARHYEERFPDLSNLPEESGLSIEDALHLIAIETPETLEKASRLVIDHEVPGGVELAAILRAVNDGVNGPEAGSKG